MCKWGEYKLVRVKIPADLSHTGKSYWKLAGIDKCIASIVEALQKGGIDMSASCCGHFKGDGHIHLQDGRILIIKKDGKDYLAKLKKTNMTPKPTTKYKFCNHHHEMTKDQEMVDFGSGKFVVDKIAIPLLKALNEIGLETRTHHIGKKRGFVGIMIDNVGIEIRKIGRERAAKRTKYNNRYELLISWDRKLKQKCQRKKKKH